MDHQQKEHVLHLLNEKILPNVSDLIGDYIGFYHVVHILDGKQVFYSKPAQKHWESKRICVHLILDLKMKQAAQTLRRSSRKKVTSTREENVSGQIALKEHASAKVQEAIKFAQENGLSTKVEFLQGIMILMKGKPCEHHSANELGKYFYP